MKVTTQDLEIISEQLGRKPDGVCEISVRGKDQRPIVIRVSPIVRGKPFPNLFWLTDPIIKKEIDKIESSGLIKTLENELIPNDIDLKEKLISDHKRYIKLRMNYIEADSQLEDVSPVYIEALKTKGVGGLSDYSRVRCLHMHFAHYLVDGNCIGEWIDKKYDISRLL
ncbi:MAG: DUF501 domain-containing protein [Bacteriovoracaceae bacterium]|nr:DUF501 domain-containing protein [Bacteriovoracaceae bacterium]